jgi:dolichyl-phosphate-mannose--protein O-mannosyl transferase
MKFYRSPFLCDFWHLNVAMMTSNNTLIPDPDKEDILASLPTDWPLMRLGLRMCAWVTRLSQRLTPPNRIHRHRHRRHQRREEARQK